MSGGGEESASQWAGRLGAAADDHPAGEASARKRASRGAPPAMGVVHDSLGDLPLGHSAILLLDDANVDDDDERVNTLYSVEDREASEARRRLAAAAALQRKKRAYNPYEEEEVVEEEARLGDASFLPPDSTAGRPVRLSYEDDGETSDPSRRGVRRTIAEVVKAPPGRGGARAQEESGLGAAGQSTAAGGDGDHTLLLSTVERRAGGAARTSRRRLGLYTDEPVASAAAGKFAALAGVPPVEASAAAVVNLDDDDLQLSMARSRRAQRLLALHTATGPAPASEGQGASFGRREGGDVEPFGDEQEEGLDGVVFSESVDFLSSLPTATSPSNAASHPPPDDGTTAQLRDAPPGAEEGSAKGAEQGAGPLAAAEESSREPLVRRGLVATLQFLARMGRQPRLVGDGEAGLSSSPLDPKGGAARFANVRIEHRDEDGNLLSAREAYKLLSHKFHGIAPGKSKLEKNLRKRAQERAIQASSFGDTPLGSGAALRDYQRTTGSAHAVLSQGRHAALASASRPAEGRAPPSQARQPGRGAKPRIFGMI